MASTASPYLTPYQQRVLALLRAERDAGRGFPSDEHLAGLLGIRSRPSQVRDTLGVLAGLGYIKRWRAPGRSKYYYSMPLVDTESTNDGEHVCEGHEGQREPVPR